MDAQLKAKWVAALMSGEYKQRRYLMCSEGAYCCLGVLREVMGTQSRGSDSEFVLTDSERRLAGLRRSEQRSLVDLNDEAEAPFPLIAGFIEANL